MIESMMTARDGGVRGGGNEQKMRKDSRTWTPVW